jgi:hypothetical protein
MNTKKTFCDKCKIEPISNCKACSKMYHQEYRKNHPISKKKRKIVSRTSDDRWCKTCCLKLKRSSFSIHNWDAGISKCKACSKIYHQERARKLKDQIVALPRKKRCGRCKLTKKSSEFFRNTTLTGLSSHCRECYRLKTRAIKRANLLTGLVIPWKKCPLCKRRKKAEEYIKQASRLDGLYTYCKSCIKKRSDLKIQQRRKAGFDPYLDTSRKRCNRCGISQVRRSFSKNLTLPDGLQYVCKNCLSKRSRELRKLKRENSKGVNSR